MKLSTKLNLIEKIKNWTASSHIGDDCAVLNFKNPVLASTDSLVEKVHFDLSTTSFFDLGWKSVAVNLSDIAAMSGKPRHLLISLVLPPYISSENLEELFGGITACAKTYQTEVAGGNLARGKELIINVTVLGEAHKNGTISRNTACVSDVIIVSGDFGASAAGFHILNKKGDLEKFAYCVKRHTKPEPRLSWSWQVIETCGGRAAMMDASDGLADALIQMSRASGLTFAIDTDKVPIHAQTREIAEQKGIDPLDWAFYGGEDYELVICLSQSDWEEIKKNGQGQFTQIGIVEKNQEALVKLIQSDNAKWNDCLNMDRVFNHFEQGNIS